MGARCTWELWKRNELESVLKCPKAGCMAGALKPYGQGYGAQACYFITWGLSFPICEVDHRIVVEKTGGGTCVNM